MYHATFHWGHLWGFRLTLCGIFIARKQSPVAVGTFLAQKITRNVVENEHLES